MIRSLRILKPNETPVKWLGQVGALAKPTKFTFAPGLNVVWGPNGSGKTTLVKLLARLFHCELGGHTTISMGSVDTIFGMKVSRDPREALRGVRVDHDGQSVFCFDPSRAVGLAAGGAAFDWDFARAGVANAMFRGSSGQTTLFRLEQVLDSFLKTRKAPAIGCKLDKERVNDLWRGRIAVVENFLNGDGPQGPPTILMDEPDRSLDLSTQVTFWRFVRAAAREAQVIVASHSVFAMGIPEATYVEMDPGYLEASKAAVALLPAWADERPALAKQDVAQAAVGEGRARKRSRRP